MAANENRKVTIRINGKEIENSIKAVEKEFHRLRNQVKNTTRGTKEYNEKVRELRRVRGMLDDHRRQVGGVRSAWKGMGGVIKGALLSFVSIGAVTAAVGSAVRTTKEFNATLDELQAITGANGEDLEYLREQAQKAGIQFGVTATNVLEAYKLAGSARPELLENTKALADFTEKAMVMSKATGEDLTKSIQDLTLIMNANNAETSEADRYINALAAASQKGAKEVPYLSQALANVGPGAASAGIAIEKNVAVLETFGEKGLDASKAGTQFRNILIAMQGDQANFTNGQFDFNKALENLEPIMNDTVALTKIFGKENVTGAQILAQNRTRVDELTEAITGTTTAYQQAIVNSDNLKSAQERLSSSYDSLMLAVMESDGMLTTLTDTLTGVLSVTRIMIKEQVGFGEASNLAQAELEGLEGTAKDLYIAEQELFDAREEASKLPFFIDDIYNRITGKDDERLESAEKSYRELRKIKDEEERLANARIEAQKKVAKEGIPAAQKYLTQLYKDYLEIKKKFDETGSILYNPDQIKREVDALDLALRDARNKQREAQDKGGSNGSNEEDNGVNRIIRSTMERLEIQKASEIDAAVEIEEVKKQLMAEGLDVRNQMHDEYLEEEKKKEEEYAQQIKQEKLEILGEGFDNGFQLLEQVASNAEQRELEALEKRKEMGLITEVKYEKEKERVQKKAFQKKKILDIAQAVINGALAVTKAMAQTGVLSPTVIPGIIASTAGQVALITAQKYEQGGLFEPLNGPSHAERGMPVIDPRTGQVRAELEGGEMIIRKSAVNASTLPTLQRINQSGQVPGINYSAASEAVMMEKGGVFGAGRAAGSNQDMQMILAAMDKWQKEFKVNLLLNDLEDETARKDKVEKLAGVAA
jgi:TP901 family phage tail tape measure protein